MDLTKLSVAEFRRITSLLKKKEKLLKQVERINAALSGGAGAAAPAVRRAKKAAPAKGARKAVRRAPRGSVKAKIVSVLKAAGAEGIGVKDLAAKMKLSTGRLHAWFYTTGKKIKEIKKVGKGRYGYMG